MYKPDYKKIAEQYNLAHNANCTPAYLAQVDKGNTLATGVRQKIREIAYRGNVLKKEYRTIDYKSLAVAVSDKIGKAVSSNYCKQVLDGTYRSSAVLKAIKEIL